MIFRIQKKDKFMINGYMGKSLQSKHIIHFKIFINLDLKIYHMNNNFLNHC
jgi:hypothetical protein